MNPKIYYDIKNKYPDVRIIAVSKYTSDENIKTLFSLGHKEFAENKVQDLLRKKEEISKEISWHFIGNLQKNKINNLIKSKPSLWQSCTDFTLANEVNKRLNYKLDCLLQINSSCEVNKSGINTQQALDEYLKIKNECNNLNLIGFMCIGAIDKNYTQKSFEDCYKIYDKAKKYGAKICSMGMSSDYELAIKCGSNMIRLGTILFK